MTDNARPRPDPVLLHLKQFALDTGDPKWSSYALDRFLEEVTSRPNGSVADVVFGLDNLLTTASIALTTTVATFIKELVIRCFNRDRTSYDLINWKDLVDRMDDEATEAQLYLALYATPPQFVTPRLAEAITTRLAGTAFGDEALRELAV